MSMIPNSTDVSFPTSSQVNHEIGRACLVVAALVFNGAMTLDMKDTTSSEAFIEAIRLTAATLTQTMYNPDDDTPVWPLEW